MKNRVLVGLVAVLAFASGAYAAGGAAKVGVQSISGGGTKSISGGGTKSISGGGTKSISGGGTKSISGGG